MTCSSIDRLKSNLDIANRSKSFSLKEDKFISDDFNAKLKKRFNLKYSKNEALKIINYVLEKIKFSINFQELKRPTIALANRVIRLFSNMASIKTNLLILDRALLQIKLHKNFILKENSILFQKWQNYGLKEELFYEYPNFSDFMMRSTLASQMKITSDNIKIIDNEPAILVEGKWTKFLEIENRFSYKYSAFYKEIFIFEKSTNEVFSYLPNSRGLQKFHPYLNAFDEVGKIQNNEYKNALKEALKFERNYLENKSKYKHILQIVTSKEKSRSNILKDSNFSEFASYQHPFIRFIDGDSKKVNILGYNLGFKARLNILKTFLGKFRSLDIWEYKSCDKKIVTNIALTDNEKEKFFNFCKKFINDDIKFGKKIAFHYMRQNCTSFVKNALEYATNEKISAELYLHELIYYLAPEILRKLSLFIKQSIHSLKNLTLKIFPKFVEKSVNFLIAKIQDIFNAIIAFSISIFASFLGAFSGNVARRLNNPESNQKFYPPLSKFLNWFNYSNYKIDFPSKLVFWQLKQKSTIIFDRPKKLRII